MTRINPPESITTLDSGRTLDIVHQTGGKSTFLPPFMQGLSRSCQANMKNFGKLLEPAQGLELLYPHQLIGILDANVRD